jgi:hypothetical protein
MHALDVRNWDANVAASPAAVAGVLGSGRARLPEHELAFAIVCINNHQYKVMKDDLIMVRPDTLIWSIHLLLFILFLTFLFHESLR